MPTSEIDLQTTLYTHSGLVSHSPTTFATATLAPVPRSVSITTTTNLATFLDGPFEVDVDTLYFVSGATSRNISINASGEIDGFVEVLYSYTPNIIAPPVPESSTWAMMMLGFAGVGFMAYRRKSKPVLLAS